MTNAIRFSISSNEKRNRNNNYFSFCQENRKVVPLSSWDSTSIFPPWLSTIFLTIDKPIPVFSCLSRLVKV